MLLAGCTIFCKACRASARFLPCAILVTCMGLLLVKNFPGGVYHHSFDALHPYQSQCLLRHELFFKLSPLSFR
jgi:hypothetical protein